MVILVWAQKDTLPVFDPSLFEPKAAGEEAIQGVFCIADETLERPNGHPKRKSLA